ncbi:hypothetical protein, partial [Polaromonas sp.]|uniref:hypothetical protein n=1 Tax=Polaromonas sp. TaxID=1869339 RepID=UPI003BB549B5
MNKAVMVRGEGRPVISRRYRFVSFYFSSDRRPPGFFESNQDSLNQTSNFSISHGEAAETTALRINIGSGGMALVKETRSCRYAQKEMP